MNIATNGGVVKIESYDEYTLQPSKCTLLCNMCE